MAEEIVAKPFAYNGKEPYIFISYAHKDAEVVVPILRVMQQQGYRIWFDVGIEAGTEWSNNIAEHLRDCEVFVAFVSPNSMSSENCLDEIAYAKSHQKTSLMIFLEENVVLPHGTEMQTARFQRMFYNRQNSMEDFIANLAGAPILAPCKGEPGSVPVVPVLPTAAPKSKGKSKLPLFIGIAAVAIAVIVALVLILGGGEDTKKKKGDADDSDEPGVTSTTPVDDATSNTTTRPSQAAQLSDKLSDYTFKLEDVVYQLPCTFTELTANGWTIGTSGYNSDVMIGGLQTVTIQMNKDGKYIDVGLFNPTGDGMRIGACYVGEVCVEVKDNVPFEVGKGITPSSTADEVVAAFGTPFSRNSYTGYEVLRYGGDSYSQIGTTFNCYSDAQQAKYSFIKIQNYTVPEGITTETNETVPKYLSDYVAPTALGTDPYTGIVSIEGDLYCLPSPVQAFLDNGWTISSGESYVVCGGESTLGLSRNGVTIELDILNLAQYQTVPQNCLVIGFTLTESDNVSVELPGGIKLGLSPQQTAACAPDTMEVSQNSYTTQYSHYESDDRDFSLYFSVDHEENRLTYISLESSTWTYTQ